MSSIDTATVKPTKMSLANIDTGDSLDVQFNPSEFEEKLGVTFSRQTIVGMSHQVLQYINTNNLTFSLEVWYTATDGPAAQERLLAARRFLHAVHYPRKATSVAAGGSPRLLFVWPGIIALTAQITELTGKFVRFNKLGIPVQYNARIGLEEVRDARLLYDDVLTSGTQRGAGKNIDLDL